MNTNPLSSGHPHQPPLPGETPPRREGSAILQSLVQASSRTVDLGRRLLNGVEAGQFARLARVGGEVIRTNHPAFIYGHLSLYPVKILSMCGMDPTGALPPAGFDERFRRDSVCVDDPEGKVYPSMEVITGAFFRNYGALLAALPGVRDETLAQVNPDARLAATFPTVGFATVFLLANHTATHLGQVSVWRRCMGMWPA